MEGKKVAQCGAYIKR